MAIAGRLLPIESRLPRSAQPCNPMMNNPPAELRRWTRLDPAEQTRLRIAYGHWLDQLPPTCAFDEKLSRFRAWLKTQGVDYDVSHVSVTRRT
jgi:hypothetical protein